MWRYCINPWWIMLPHCAFCRKWLKNGTVWSNLFLWHNPMSPKSASMVPNMFSLSNHFYHMDNTKKNFSWLNQVFRFFFKTFSQYNLQFIICDIFLIFVIFPSLFGRAFHSLSSLYICTSSAYWFFVLLISSILAIFIWTQKGCSMLFKRFNHSLVTPCCNRSTPSKLVWLMNRLFQINLIWIFLLFVQQLLIHSWRRYVFYFYISIVFFFFTSFNVSGLLLLILSFFSLIVYFILNILPVTFEVNNFWKLNSLRVKWNKLHFVDYLW